MNSKIEFYTNPEDMPIKRFQRFNKYYLIDLEVGEDFADYDQRTQKAVSLLKRNMKEDAVKELQNRRQMVFNAYEEYSPKGYALALLVKSIDGVDYTDKRYNSEEGLNEILQKLDEAGYTRKQLETDLQDVKKNSLKFWKCISRSTLRRMTRKILISFLRNV